MLSIISPSTPTPPRFSQRTAWTEESPISDLMSRALAHPQLVSLAAGFVDQKTLPIEGVAEAFADLLNDPADARAALQYGTTPGYAPLRAHVLDLHCQLDGTTAAAANLTIDRVVLTAGSNQLLHLVAESLLDPGDIVLCAAPTYFVFLGLLANLGARAIGVASDADGIRPDALEATLAKIDAAGDLARVKAIYVVSDFENPSGATLSAERRPQVVEIARRWSRLARIYVLEDAAYRELRYEGDHLPSLRSFDPEGITVVHAGTFSKSFSPGIRVGWGLLPPCLVEPVCNRKGNIDFGSPNFAQHLVDRVIRRGGYGPQVSRLKTTYSEKLQATLAAADQFLRGIPGVSWEAPCGGLYLWLQLPPGLDAGTKGPLFDLAIEEGVLYVPGEYCFAPEGEPVRRNTIRLSFGVPTVERIAEGVAALGRALRKVV